MITQSQHIRWLIRRDLPQVLEIDRASFAEPWTENDMRTQMAKNDHIGMVAERGDTILGYMAYRLLPKKFHLLRLAVHPDHRRIGVGSDMVRKLVGKLDVNRRKALVVNVPETNLPAQMFFHANGLLATMVLRHWFGSEDAFRMEYRL